MAGIALLAGPVGAATSARADTGHDDRAARVVVPDTPLRVSIDALSPASLPQTGTVVVRGTVTNRSADPWTDIRLYAFLGDDAAPMRNAAQLDAATAVPTDAYVGDRLTSVGSRGVVDSLGPGASASFRVEVPARAVQVGSGGVYWFGVHALGTSPAGRDQLADGRARTFMTSIPDRVRTPLPVALVLPLVRELPYEADGSLAEEPQWLRSLSPGGRLFDLLDFADAAGDRPLTLLIDPALLDAVARLAAGNPARSLAPTDPDSDPADADPTDDPTAGATPGQPAASPFEPADDDDGAGDGTGGADDTELVMAARAWLQRVRPLLQQHQVLTLPYGNLDVAAALAHDPGLLRLARAQRSEVMQAADVEGSAALSSPRGYLDVDSILAAEDDTTVLASDLMFPGPAPTVASVEGHRVVVTSAGAAAGSPGPGPQITAVGLRQRILAEAAVRVLQPDPRPLVVTLPTDWTLDGAAQFFAGLDVDWLDLDTVRDVDSEVTATDVRPDRLTYPPSQGDRELEAASFDAVDQLVRAGDTLQGMLARPTTVGEEVTEQALAGVSFAARNAPLGSRSSLVKAREAIEDLMGEVTISVPRGVTLSSADGSFAATVTNGLDEVVTVAVVGTSDPDLQVVPSGPVTIAPGARANVQLAVQTTGNRVHDVTLHLTDADGRLLGSGDELPIRSAQVSEVIWLIIGTGAGVLFVAIGIRLVRRIRSGGLETRGARERAREPLGQPRTGGA